MYQVHADGITVGGAGSRKRTAEQNSRLLPLCSLVCWWGPDPAESPSQAPEGPKNKSLHIGYLQSLLESRLSTATEATLPHLA